MRSSVLSLAMLAAAEPFSLEIMYLQDLSSSIGAKVPTEALVSAFATLNSTHEHCRFGVGTFIDRPESPYGAPGTYCYKLQYPLTHDGDTFRATVRQMRPHSGGDAAECQLTALAEASQASLNRWTVAADQYETGARIVRLVVLTTDSPYHKAGDFTEEGYDANGNLKRFARPEYEPTSELPAIISSRSLESLSRRLDELDYPSERAVRALFDKTSITPLLLVTENVLGLYQRLVMRLGRGHVAVVAPDLHNLPEVLIQSVEHVVQMQESFGCTPDGHCPCDQAAECQKQGEEELLVQLEDLPRVIRLARA